MNTYIALDFIPSVFVAVHLEGIIFGLGASMLLSKEGIQEIGGQRWLYLLPASEGRFRLCDMSMEFLRGVT